MSILALQRTDSDGEYTALVESKESSIERSTEATELLSLPLALKSTSTSGVSGCQSFHAGQRRSIPKIAK
jgi:hypothetical protein